MNTYRFLKKNSAIVLMVLLLAVASCSFTTKKFDPGDNDKEEVLSNLVTFVLENYHYSPKDIDKEFSKNVYEDFVKSLDPRKRFFLKSDIEEFSKYEDKLHQQIKDNKVDFFNLAYNRLQERMEEMKSVYGEILDQPFDLETDEEINTDFDEIDYPESEEARKDLWRKQLKFSVITSFYDLKKEQEQREERKAKGEEGTADTEEEDELPENKEHVRIHGENVEVAKDNDKTDLLEDEEPKTDAELEKEARKSARHSLDQFYDISKDLTKADWFSMYLNAIANEFDPHTGYFAPPDKDRFDIAMSGSLEGIGAQLQKDMDDVKVMKLISGGPAWTDGRLKVGDVIKQVKQEDEDKPVNIVGMSLNDAVELIRGPKGTKVTLTIKSVDGTTKTIELVRDVVELEETYAKSAITEKDGKSFGVIKLPSFYFNMEDYDKRNAASDIKKEIDYLKNQNIEGLAIDLRDNGGGSLSTAIDIAGLFIDKGPVVQVRSGDNQQQVLKHKNPAVHWDGPLVIMVNELSASASEILAAAMQDYGRAVVLGSKQTYGKGTVQKFIDLNRFMRSNKLGDMGSLKITSQKFYRINGGATQLKGVNSDIVVPDQYSFIDVGERDLDGPLPWDEIKQANYSKWDGYANFDEVLELSKKRIDTSSQFNLIKENAQWIKAQRDENTFPLQYSAYKTKVEESEKQVEHFKKISKYKADFSFNSLPEEIARFEKDTTLAEKRKRWHKNLTKDVYIEEALHILDDLKLSDEQQKKMAKAKD